MENYINVGNLNNMEKEIYKLLPDGNPSGLSLNQFKIYTTTNSKWNNCKGKEIYSLEIFIKKIVQAYPEYENIENFDVLEFIRNNYKNEKKYVILLTNL